MMMGYTDTIDSWYYSVSAEITSDSDLNKVYDGEPVEEPEYTVTVEGEDITNEAEVTIEWYKVVEGADDDSENPGYEGGTPDYDTGYGPGYDDGSNPGYDDGNPGYDTGYNPGYNPGYGGNIGYGDEKLSGPPTEVGEYYCLIIVSGTENYLGNSLRIDFAITEAEPPVQAEITSDSDLNKVYDGVAVADPVYTVTAGEYDITDVSGAVIEWYMVGEEGNPGYDNGYDTGYDTGYTSGDVKLDGAPSEVGVYYCLITVADGSADVESLTRSAEQISWLGDSLRIDFEITPADDTEDPTDPEQPTDPEDPTQAPTEKPESGKPETGDAFNPIWFVLLMVSLCGVVVLNTFRKEWVL